MRKLGVFMSGSKSNIANRASAKFRQRILPSPVATVYYRRGASGAITRFFSRFPVGSAASPHRPLDIFIRRRSQGDGYSESAITCVASAKIAARSSAEAVDPIE